MLLLPTLAHHLFVLQKTNDGWRKTLSKHRIAVVGVGYVGLPLAIALGKEYQVVGFDVNPKELTI